MASAWFCEHNSSYGSERVEFTGADANDQLIAYLYARTWATWSGHPVPERPVDELTNDELIDFWADDDVVWL